MNQHDPVCGAALRPASAVASVAYGGNMYHFCSQECHGRFWANPDLYLADKGSDADIELAASSIRRGTPLPWHQTE